MDREEIEERIERLEGELKEWRERLKEEKEVPKMPLNREDRRNVYSVGGCAPQLRWGWLRPVVEVEVGITPEAAWALFDLGAGFDPLSKDRAKHWRAFCKAYPRERYF